MGIPKQLQAEVDVLESLHADMELGRSDDVEFEYEREPDRAYVTAIRGRISKLKEEFDGRPTIDLLHGLAWWQLRAELLSKKMGELSAVDPECDGCVRLRSELESVRSELNYERTYKSDCVKRVTLAEDALSGLERYLAWKADDDI